MAKYSTVLMIIATMDLHRIASFVSLIKQKMRAITVRVLPTMDCTKEMELNPPTVMLLKVKILPRRNRKTVRIFTLAMKLIITEQ